MLWHRWVALWLVGSVCLLPATTVAFADDYVFAPLGHSTRTDVAVNWVPVGGPTGPADRVVSIDQALGTGERTTTAAQIPDGFELVWITDDPEQDAWWPQINNCGEIVFATKVDGTYQFMLYDNDKLTQLTFGPADVDGRRFSSINNFGTIVWQDGRDALFHGDIVMRRAGMLTTIGNGVTPVLNDVEQVVWHNWYDVGCFDGDGDMFFWDDGQTTQLTAGLSNQLPQINASGHAVWTEYDFCPNPWHASPALFEGESVEVLPSQLKALVPDVSNEGVVAWGGPNGIEIWQDGNLSLFTDWGRNPRLNESEDIAFLRFYDANETWQVWLYSNNQFVQITDDPFWNSHVEINDYGELALRSGDPVASLLRMMQRIRNGDVDFNGQVEQLDYAAYPDCATGPFDTDRLCDCRFLDIDHDRDIDLLDFAAFANGFGEL